MSFMERKARRVARQVERRKKIFTKVPRKANPLRATPHPLLVPNDEHVDVQDSSATGLVRRQLFLGFNIWYLVLLRTVGHIARSMKLYCVAQEGWNRRTDHHCVEETTISPFGAVFAIISLREFLLHQLSLSIGYAKYLVCQIRLVASFVSQQLSTLSVEFEQHPAEHDERHFAEEEQG